jgi:TolB-like protein
VLFRNWGKTMKIKHLLLFIVICILLSTITEATAQVRRSKKRALAQGKRAMELFRDGNYDESGKIFLNLLEKNKQSLIPKEMLALIGFKKNDAKMAETYARMALRQNYRSARAHFVMAYVSKSHGKLLAALDHYRKAQKYAKTAGEKDFFKAHVLKLKRPDRQEVIGEESATALLEVPPGEMPYIAIFVFEESGADSGESQLGMTIAEMLITSLFETRQFKIFERYQLDKILEEQALGMSGALDTETAVDVGKIIGVDAILTGSCSRIGERIELDARIIHAASAEIKIAAAGTAKHEERLRQAVNEIARKLAQDAGKLEN